MPGYIHDLDYNKLQARGFNSLINDPKTQGANVKLVNSEFIIAAGASNPITRARALIVGGFIAESSLYNSFSNTVKNIWYVR